MSIRLAGGKSNGMPQWDVGIKMYSTTVSPDQSHTLKSLGHLADKVSLDALNLYGESSDVLADGLEDENDGSSDWNINSPDSGVTSTTNGDALQGLKDSDLPPIPKAPISVEENVNSRIPAILLNNEEQESNSSDSPVDSMVSQFMMFSAGSPRRRGNDYYDMKKW